MGDGGMMSGTRSTNPDSRLKHGTQSDTAAPEQSIPERRTRTQGEGPYWTHVSTWPTGTSYPGTIAWSEHEEIWAAYAKKHGTLQDAELTAARGGFGYWEAAYYLGHEPRTWRAVVPEKDPRR